MNEARHLQRLLLICLWIGWFQWSTTALDPTTTNHDGGNDDDDEYPPERMEDDEIPPILERHDIAYFFPHGMEGLFEVLQFLFEHSARMPADDDDDNENDGDEEHYSTDMIPLPQELLVRGSGMSFTTRAKLTLDLEQALYLAETLDDETEASFFQDVAAPIYQAVLDNIPATFNDTSLYFFTQQDYDESMIDLVYNKAWRPTAMEPLVDESTGDLIPLMNPLNDESLRTQWETGPGVLVLDNFLTAEALTKLQQLLLETTVWYESNPVHGGHISSAHLDDGLFDKLLLQLAYEIPQRLEPIMDQQDMALHDLWARKYDTTRPSTPTFTTLADGSLHVGDPVSSIHVHLWLTPNPPPESTTTGTSTTTMNGGDLVVFTAQPPPDWALTLEPSQVLETVLRPSGYANVTVPFQVNRAIVFDASLFYHTTGPVVVHSESSETRVRDATTRYTSRRTELVLLYGASSYGDEAEESQASEVDEL